jgi:hypothetical protein
MVTRTRLNISLHVHGLSCIDLNNFFWFLVLLWTVVRKQRERIAATVTPNPQLPVYVFWSYQS